MNGSLGSPGYKASVPTHCTSSAKIPHFSSRKRLKSNSYLNSDGATRQCLHGVATCEMVGFPPWDDTLKWHPWHRQQLTMALRTGWVHLGMAISVQWIIGPLNGSYSYHNCWCQSIEFWYEKQIFWINSKHTLKINGSCMFCFPRTFLGSAGSGRN